MIWDRFIKRTVKQESRRATAYRIDETIILTPQGSWKGAWFTIGPAISIPQVAEPQNIGKAIRQCLTHSTALNDMPNLKETCKSLFDTANVRSWPALQKKSSACSILSDSTSVEIAPYRNGGMRGDDKGFHRLDHKRIRLALDCSDAQLGGSLMQAFDGTE
jgi:hypothetical protein